jgi:plasmid stabilization system protein ParE
LEVIVTGKAAHDLDEWLSHIEADNPAAAEAFQARIRHWIEVIRQHPQAGHRHPKRREIRTVYPDFLTLPQDLSSVGKALSTKAKYAK